MIALAGKPGSVANAITTLIADDIQTAAGFGGQLATGYTFAVANLNPLSGGATTSVRARTRFYAANGTGGLPGTFLGGQTFNAFAFANNSITRFGPTVNPVGIFTIPVNGQFWAAITFDNNSGATGATAAQLNNFGVALLNPTIGSSFDAAFETTTNGSFNVNNPAGTLFNFGNATNPANPLANFGFDLVTSTAPVVVPEAGSLTLILPALGILGVVARRRRNTV